MRELAAHGHREIGFLNNQDDIPATGLRLAGFRRGLEEIGVAFRPDMVISDEANSAGGYRAATKLLDRPGRPTALFCFNDRMAMGAYQAAADLGLRIPEDLSVVGFDNQENIADGLRPGLTTLALPHYEMGQWAVRTLVDLVDSGDQQPCPAGVTLPCPLVRRASVGSPPGRYGRRDKRHHTVNRPLPRAIPSPESPDINQLEDSVVSSHPQAPRSGQCSRCAGVIPGRVRQGRQYQQ